VEISDRLTAPFRDQALGWLDTHPRATMGQLREYLSGTMSDQLPHIVKRAVVDQTARQIFEQHTSCK